MKITKRKRCSVCNKLSEHWTASNNSPIYCSDGCYHTTGIDNRTINGKPMWEGNALKEGTLSFGRLINSRKNL